jgi:hypothetical protein
MPVRVALLLACLPTSGLAQVVRLVDRIERPMAYVSYAAPLERTDRHGPVQQGDVDPTGPRGVASETRRDRILGLLAGPAMQELLGEGSSMFQFLRRVVARADGEVELALTGIVPPGLGPDGLGSDRDIPLVIVRARLGAKDADRMRAVLAGGDAGGEADRVARRVRVIDGHDIFELGGKPGAVDPRAAAGRIEVAVVGRDLVVANHGSGMDEAVGRSTVSGSGRTLGSDERFRALRERLDLGPDALLVFADWRRLSRRLTTAESLSWAMVDWSGLSGADYLMTAVQQPETNGGSDFKSTVLVSFGEDQAPQFDLQGAAKASINGWLDLIEPDSLSRLADDMYWDGLASMVVSIEPRRLLRHAHRDRHDHGHDGRGRDGRLRRDHSHEHSHFADAVLEGVLRCGLDAEEVVDRLAKRGAVQLLWLKGEEDRVVPAFCLQARRAADASTIYRDLERAVLERGLGERIDLRGRRGGFLRIDGGPHLGRMHVAQVADNLVFSQDATAVESMLTAPRNRRRLANKNVFAQAIQAFHGRRIPSASINSGGLLHLDAADWMSVHVGVLDGQDDLRLPTLHTGMIDIMSEGGPAGTILRLQLYSTE